MAVDSAQKRFSMVMVSIPWRTPYIFTDGVAAIDADERAEAIWQYSGISLATVSVTDSRTVSGRIIMAFNDGDTFAVRAIRTEGGSALQTIADGSGITAIVYRN